MSIHRRSLALVVALGATLVPTTALASHGGGGGGGGSTPPPVLTTDCDYSHDGWIAPDEYLGTMPVKNAGCVSIVTGISTIRLYSVSPQPGWTYEVTSNGGGTNSRVAVRFSNSATGERAELRYEFGKTVIS
jgi:hypothetical protein